MADPLSQLPLPPLPNLSFTSPVFAPTPIPVSAGDLKLLALDLTHLHLVS
jgi:hypothetical protein